MIRVEVERNHLMQDVAFLNGEECFDLDDFVRLIGLTDEDVIEIDDYDVDDFVDIWELVDYLYDNFTEIDSCDRPHRKYCISYEN